MSKTFRCDERVWTPRGEGRTVRVEDVQENEGDWMWSVMLDRDGKTEQYEEMFLERNMRQMLPPLTV